MSAAVDAPGSAPRALRGLRHLILATTPTWAAPRGRAARRGHSAREDRSQRSDLQAGAPAAWVPSVPAPADPARERRRLATDFPEIVSFLHLWLKVHFLFWNDGAVICVGFHVLNKKNFKCPIQWTERLLY